RPLLACRWIESGRGLVPVEFAKLVDAVLPDSDDLPRISADLVRRKTAGRELDKGPRIEGLDRFLTTEIARLGVIAGSMPDPPGDIEPLNALFREVAGF